MMVKTKNLWVISACMIKPLVLVRRRDLPPTTRGSTLLLPPISKRNHNKSTRDRYCQKRVQISARRLLTMGEL